MKKVFPRNYKRVTRFALKYIADEFLKIWRTIEAIENALIKAGLMESEKEITIPVDQPATGDQPNPVKDDPVDLSDSDKADNEIDEFEQVKKEAEELGIQVRSNSKIETLKQKIAEKKAENA